MPSVTVGRTVWDVFYEIINKGHPWLITVILILLIGYIILHPNIAKEWNVIFFTFISNFMPQKRKKTFERRIELTIQKAHENVKKTIPEYVQRFLPYSLKVEWVEPNDNSSEENIDSVINDKQIILYVPSYKNEEKQTISILYSYCAKGFATKAKCYMKNDDRKAADLLITGKLAQNAGHHIFDYYNRVYVRDILEIDSALKRNYNELKKIDVDGLFLPIYINEIDKYANRIYESGISERSLQTIENFKRYLLRIIEKKPDEDVDLDFCEEGISVHIELAVGSYGTESQLKSVVNRLESLVNHRRVNTIYVIASGRKMELANEIVTGLEERVLLDIYEPQCTQYKRYTKISEGKDSLCYEINIRDF